jgi:hypothetical protein
MVKSSGISVSSGPPDISTITYYCWEAQSQAGVWKWVWKIVPKGSDYYTLVNIELDGMRRHRLREA